MAISSVSYGSVGGYPRDAAQTQRSSAQQVQQRSQTSASPVDRDGDETTETSTERAREARQTTATEANGNSVGGANSGSAALTSPALAAGASGGRGQIVNIQA